MLFWTIFSVLHFFRPLGFFKSFPHLFCSGGNHALGIEFCSVYLERQWVEEHFCMQLTPFLHTPTLDMSSSDLCHQLLSPSLNHVCLGFLLNSLMLNCWCLSKPWRNKLLPPSKIAAKLHGMLAASHHQALFSNQMGFLYLLSLQ